MQMCNTTHCPDAHSDGGFLCGRSVNLRSYNCFHVKSVWIELSSENSYVYLQDADNSSQLGLKRE